MDKDRLIDAEAICRAKLATTKEGRETLAYIKDFEERWEKLNPKKFLDINFGKKEPATLIVGSGL